MRVWGSASFDALTSFSELCRGYLELTRWCFTFAKSVGVRKKDLDDGIRLREIVAVGVDDIAHALFDSLIRFSLGYFFSMLWFSLAAGPFCFDGFGIWSGIEHVESRLSCCVKSRLKSRFVILYFSPFPSHVLDGRRFQCLSSPQVVREPNNWDEARGS